ncbi:hypothetical protein F511_42437 [Dorcoceras hygrometricum]|uniref:Uncharacterized protein n=1 Tax=Dorcoceras hygrometricum TaxID=472368 RepID=A0A2Z7B1N3_9LAMI|nr:hypothetical protein F511_42437 [Dorcoceras hygrometricum]
MTKIPINHRILMRHAGETNFPDDQIAINFPDTVFEFLCEDYEGLSMSTSSIDDDDDEDEEKENQNGNVEDSVNFWETQNQMLQATLWRTSSLESRIRKVTKEALKEAQRSGNACVCGRTSEFGCRRCLMEEVRRRLQDAGFNCAICKSKWRSTSDLPSGEHTFLDVVDTSNPKKEVRVIIELNFRAEFEMARASDEYNRLIKSLPEIYVGKIERLLGLLKILCAGAKKFMKERKIHLGPWRKHRYMQAKWLRTCERLTLSASPLSVADSDHVSRPRASLLSTADMMGNFSNFHRSAVRVV